MLQILGKGSLATLLRKAFQKRLQKEDLSDEEKESILKAMFEEIMFMKAKVQVLDNNYRNLKELLYGKDRL